MIKFTHLHDPRLSEESLTFGRAATDLLTLAAQHDWIRALPSIGNSVLRVAVNKNTFCAEYSEQGSSMAFRSLNNFAFVLNELLWAEHDGQGADLEEVLRVVTGRGKSCGIPPLTADSFSSRPKLIRYCCEWLVGRKIEGTFDDSEALTALCMAVQAELDGEGTVEKSLATLAGN